MSRATKLYAQYKADLKKLQEECPHSQATEYQKVYWAVGHSSGYSSKSCKECAKELSKMYWCGHCRKELVDAEALQGTGHHPFPLGPQFCKDCLSLTTKEVHERFGMVGGYNVAADGTETCSSCGFSSPQT